MIPSASARLSSPKSKVARALSPPFLALILAAGAAPSASGGETAGGGKGPTIDWSQTRDPLEFEPEKPATPDGADGSGRRGPVIPIPPEVPGPGQKETPEAGAGVGPAPQKPEQLLLWVRAMAEDRALRAEEQLARQDYPAVVETTVDALNRIKEVQLPAPALVERLSRAHETARRLKERGAIEEQFRNLAISIGAVAWSPTNPVALINGELRRPGDTVLGARIEEIGRGEVVFSLKGVRLRRISGAVSGN